MPASYCFAKKSDGTNETLSVIDDKVAEYFGETPSKKFKPFEDMISDFGLNILMKHGGSEVTPELFAKWISNLIEKDPDRFANIAVNYNGKAFPALFKFLCQDYTFKAWR